MKKTYILPQTWAVEIKSEQMLAVSLNVNTSGSEEITGDGDWLTRHKDFDWSEIEEEEDFE